VINLFKQLTEPAANYLTNNENLIAPEAAHSFLAASAKSPLLIITTSSRKSEELSQEIASWVGKEKVINFPAWETLPHEKLSPKADTVAARFKALNKLKSNEVKIVVCSIRAFF